MYMNNWCNVIKLLHWRYYAKYSTKAYIQINLISYCKVRVIKINNKYFTVYVNPSYLGVGYITPTKHVTPNFTGLCLAILQ